MSKQIQIPDIGSDEVTVTEVMVKVGDTITADPVSYTHLDVYKRQGYFNLWHTAWSRVDAFKVELT